MANTLGIRRKIKSVRNVKQITSAMELTAAAKMHRATSHVLATRPYATRALHVIRELTLRGAGDHPLFEIRSLKKQLMIVVTSNRGLAGGLNNQLIRAVVKWHKEHPETEYIVIGKKGSASLHRLQLPIIASFVDLPQSPDMAFSRPISLIAREEFLKNTYGACHIAYNHYHSTLTQTPTITTLLPFQSQPPNTQSPEINESEALFEPGPREVLDYVLPQVVDHIVFQILIEATASEHAARMVAMRNATDNAGDVLDDLQLAFNSIRQASITAEMAEISASMTALE